MRWWETGAGRPDSDMAECLIVGDLWGKAGVEENTVRAQIRMIG